MKHVIASLLLALTFLALSISSNSVNAVQKIQETQQVVSVCEGTQGKLSSTVNDMIEEGWQTESAPYYNPITDQWCQQMHD